MSHSVPTPSHRKPRRNAAGAWKLRAGVATGVLSTIAVTGASSSANASERASETLELPAVTASLADAAAQSSAATQQAAEDYQQRAELQKQQDRAADSARKVARKAKLEAEAERKAKAAREAREAAQDRAARSSERTTLSSTATAAKSSTATGSTAKLVDFLEAQVGKAYVLGASGPSAYDCSGLTQVAFRTVGVDLPRVSQDQSATGTSVSLDSLQAGDILYWGGRGSAYHVAVYVGGGMYIDAANPEKGVVKQKLSDWPPDGATRVL